MENRIVAVIGGNGQLGTDVVAAFARRGFDARALTHADIRVDEAASVNSVIGTLRPAVVVNTAAFHVPAQCERDPERAFAVNALGARNVAQAASAARAVNIYVSTDYVFDGTKGAPYTETDRPHPMNVYGVTKLAGEEFTRGQSEHPLVVRVSGLYGAVPCRAKGTNFVQKMIDAAGSQSEVRVVTDEILTPTPTTVVADAMVDLVAAGARGTFHLSCEGECSWFTFARAIFAEMGFATPLVPVTARDAPADVLRPAYSVLENAAWRALGRPALPHWRWALNAFLRGTYLSRS